MLIIDIYMKKIVVLLLSIITCIEVSSNDSTKVFQGYSGGMMLHTGYLFGQDKNAPIAADGRSCSPQGAIWGLGGSIRVHLWKYLRTGFEGGVSNMNSGWTDCNEILQKGSYVRMGYGGVLADACWRLEKIWPYIGGTIGGGTIKGLYILEGNQEDWIEETHSVFHKNSFFYVTPYVGFDYCMTKRIHLTFRFDWMLAFHKNELVMPTGPRLYFGFMFTH